MTVESIENFLTERTARDVTASELVSRLHLEYTAYCIFRDYLPEGFRTFCAYLYKLDKYRKVRPHPGRVQIQGLRLTGLYNSY